MQVQDQEIKVSKYNSGVAQLYRLDSLWKDTHKFSRTGKHYYWNLTLDRIWCELSRDLAVDEYETYQKKFEKLDTEIGVIKDSSDGFKNPTQEDMNKRSKQYRKLIEKDLFLRRLENHLGKGTAWADGSEDDFE